jgi:hypothetical protein
MIAFLSVKSFILDNDDYLKKNSFVLNVSQMAFDTSKARNDRSLKKGEITHQ